MKIHIKDIEKVQFEPGDVLFVKTYNPMTPEQVDEMKKCFVPILAKHDVQICVLPADVELSIASLLDDQ